MLRNPRAFGGGDSRPPLATHTGIRTSIRSTVGHPTTSPLNGTLPYQAVSGARGAGDMASVASVTGVAPLDSRRRGTFDQ